VTTSFDPAAAKTRLLELIRERAYKDGIDIVLASGKHSDFYINGKQVSLHPEGLWLIAKLLLEKLKAYPEITAVGGLTLGADPLASAVAALSYESGQHLSAFLVRKEAKGHGTGSRIEGDLAVGQKVHHRRHGDDRWLGQEGDRCRARSGRGAGGRDGDRRSRRSGCRTVSC